MFSPNSVVNLIINPKIFIMKSNYHILVLLILSSLFLPDNVLAQNSEAKATLWGIYGDHDKHDCPINNKETAIAVIALSQMDLNPIMKKYGVVKFVDKYHSGLEHTLLWAVETYRPHDLEEFCIELGLAGWNNLKFVPLRTFEEGVIPDIKAIHNL